MADTLSPDRIVVGVTSGRAEEILRQVYARPLASGASFIATGLETAELAKAAANACKHGFESVTQHLAGEYERYQEVAERHGLDISGERLRAVVAHFDDIEPEQGSAWRKILEGTTGALLRQSGLAG